MERDHELADRPGYAVKQVDALFRARMDKGLRPLDLSASQYAVLAVLAESGGVSISELARRTFVTRQSAHQLLGGLEQRGLLTRGSGPGRAVPMRLTTAGRDAVDDAESAVADVERRMVSGLDPEQIHVLMDLLARCAGGLAAD